MKYIFYSLILFVIILYFSTNIDNTKQPEIINNTKKEFNEIDYIEFDKFFNFEDIISFNINQLIIGEISKILPLDRKNKFIINDKISDKVFWCNLKEKKFKILNVERQIPGHKINLAGIFKEKSGSFWISSHPQYYFKFDKNGNLTNNIKFTKRMVSFKFAVHNNESLIGYYRKWNNQPKVIYFDLIKNRETKNFTINFPDAYLDQIYRTVESGGFLLDDHQNVFIANAIENIIYKYDYKGKLNAQLKSSYSDFAKMKIPKSKNKNDIINFFQENNRFSMFINMFFLNEDTIVTLCAIENRPYIELFSVSSGQSLNKKAIALPYHLVYAENNLLYLVKRSRIGEKLNNPQLIIYRMDTALN